MAEMLKNLSHATHHGADKSQTVKQSLQPTRTNINNGVIINAITGYENNLEEQLEQFEREAAMQAQQIELSECLEFVAQLVDLFKHTVIIPQLQLRNDWHDNHRHQLKRNKGVTGNSFLDHKVEKIAISKGLTKEQWNRLLYLVLNTGDSIEVTKVSRKHLQKVHHMASRLLDSDQQSVIFSLINAIEEHMPKDHFTGT